MTYHPHDQIIGDTSDHVRTRHFFKGKITKMEMISQIEPKNINDTIKDMSWIEPITDDLSKFKKNQVWNLVPCPQDKTIN